MFFDYNTRPILASVLMTGAQNKHRFMEHCGFVGVASYVELISGPWSVAQLTCSRPEYPESQTKITMWGEDHLQSGACYQCSLREGCWYLPLLFYYSDADVVVLAEASGPSRPKSHGDSVYESMLSYTQHMFTERNRYTGEVGSYFTSFGDKHTNVLPLGGRGRDAYGDRGPVSVSFFQSDLRSLPMRQAQWDRLWTEFPVHMRLLGLRANEDESEGPALFTAVRNRTHREDFHRFAHVFTELALEWLPADHVQRLVPFVLSGSEKDTAPYSAALRGRYDADAFKTFIAALFSRLMDIHMLANLEQQLMLQPPPTHIHMLMGAAHLPNMLRVVRELPTIFPVRLSVTQRLVLPPIDEMSFSTGIERQAGCFDPATYQFDAEPPSLRNPKRPRSGEVDREPSVSPRHGHWLRIVEFSQPRAPMPDSSDSFNIVVAHRSEGSVPAQAGATPGSVVVSFSDPPFALPAPGRDDAFVYGRLAPLVDVARMTEFERRKWTLQSDDAIRFTAAMLDIELGDLTADEVVSFAQRVLERSVPPGLQYENLASLLAAAYAETPWRVENYDQLQETLPGTLHRTEGCVEAAHRIMAPTLSVAAVDRRPARADSKRDGDD